MQVVEKEYEREKIITSRFYVLRSFWKNYAPTSTEVFRLILLHYRVAFRPRSVSHRARFFSVNFNCSLLAFLHPRTPIPFIYPTYLFISYDTPKISKFLALHALYTELFPCLFSITISTFVQV